MSISKNNNKVFSVSLFLQDPININASCFEELYKKIQYKFNLKAHQYFIIQTQFIWDDIPIEFNELDLSLTILLLYDNDQLFNSCNDTLLMSKSSSSFVILNQILSFSEEKMAFYFKNIQENHKLREEIDRFLNASYCPENNEWIHKLLKCFEYILTHNTLSNSQTLLYYQWIIKLTSMIFLFPKSIQRYITLLSNTLFKTILQYE